MRTLLAAGLLSLNLSACAGPDKPASAAETDCIREAEADPAYKLLINKAIGNQTIQDQAVGQERRLKRSLTRDCLKRAAGRRGRGASRGDAALTAVPVRPTAG